MSARIYGAGKKDESVAILKDQIKNNRPARVYLFFGDEHFLIDYYVGELKKLIVGKDDQGLNLVIFEKKTDINSIIDACDTFPIFAERKLVIVKNSSLFHSRNKKELSGNDGPQTEESGSDNALSQNLGSKAQEALKKYIPEIPESTCLIFIESQVDKRLGLYKQVVKSGLALEFNKQSERDLANWVAKGARQSGKTMSAEAASYLVSICEPDMYTLKNELMKIIAYVGEKKEITLEDVKLMAIPTIKSVIFDLLDAVAQKNSAKALRLLDDMLIIKEPEQKILAMLSKQTGELLKIKRIMKQRDYQEQINKYFQGKHPYALKMLISQAERMDEGYLERLLRSCMEADTSNKKGKINSRLSLEVLLAGITNTT